MSLSHNTTAPSDLSMITLSSSPSTTSSKSTVVNNTQPNRAVGVWSSEEHDRFLEALKKYPQGPWKAITKVVRTRSVRQVQTHAQKYQEKISRRLHGLQTGKAIRLRREHRIDHEVLAQDTLLELRNKYARPNHHHEVKFVPGSMPPAVAMDPVKPLPFQCPAIVPVVLDGKHFDPIMDNNGASPSSVSSSFHFDDAVFTDTNDLPTLSESLDFFIDNLL